jgi:hypothetical protein
MVGMFTMLAAMGIGAVIAAVVGTVVGRMFR